MTAEQIAELERCAAVPARGVLSTLDHELLGRLLEERKRLLEALRVSLPFIQLQTARNPIQHNAQALHTASAALVYAEEPAP